MITKLFICPWFGPLPPWYAQWEANSERLKEHGYDFLFDTDEEAFRARVLDRLGIVCPPMEGTGKVWDYRPALGLLYEEETTGFDFWGHTDFDVVYGRVERWVTDGFLEPLDMHSNCTAYVNGCWSLYRNSERMRMLFQDEPLWQPIMEDVRPHGWAEKEFSKLIAAAHRERSLRKAWTQWQVFGDNDLDALRFDGDRLMVDNTEVMMAHFRRTKRYPSGCVA